MPPLSHDWAVTPKQAIELQKKLANRVIGDDRFGPVRTLGGIDVAYGRRGGPARAAVVILDPIDFRILEQATVVRDVAFPYVPGLLSFREAPAALAAIERLCVRPDLLLCDGQGLAHPRRFGIASHLGLYLDIPTIGVGKSRLIGDHGEPGPERGDRAPLVHKDEVIGAALRSRRGTKPIYVSIGHRISLDSAVEWVLRCTTRFRLPEPIRAADRLSKQAIELPR